MYKLDSKMEHKFYVNLPQPVIKNIQRNSICTFSGKVKKNKSAIMHRNIYIYKNVFFYMQWVTCGYVFEIKIKLKLS